MSPSQPHHGGSENQQQERGSITQGTSQQPDPYLAEGLAALEHEVRTPLAVIMGYTSMLARSHQHLSRQEQDEILQGLLTAGGRLSFLFDRLLEFAWIQAGLLELKLDLLDLPGLLQETLRKAKGWVPEPLQQQTTFHLHCRDEVGKATQNLPAVKGDLRWLRKVFEHLLENAIRFSPNGGRIDVVVQPIASAQTETHEESSLEAPAFLEICVCDVGVGMASSHLTRIFEPFYRIETTLTRQSNSLGLGLAVCQRLAALHHGRLFAQSCPDGGSALHFWLPIEPVSLPSRPDELKKH